MFWQLITQCNLQKTYSLDISEVEQFLICALPFLSHPERRCPCGTQPKKGLNLSTAADNCMDSAALFVKQPQKDYFTL